MNFSQFVSKQNHDRKCEIRLNLQKSLAAAMHRFKVLPVYNYWVFKVHFSELQPRNVRNNQIERVVVRRLRKHWRYFADWALWPFWIPSQIWVQRRRSRTEKAFIGWMQGDIEPRNRSFEEIEKSWRIERSWVLFNIRRRSRTIGF